MREEEALAGPNGVMPYEEDGRRFLRLFFDYQGLADKFIGIIQWDSDKRDTLVHQFNQTGKEKHLVRVLHDSQPLWELGDTPAAFISFKKSKTSPVKYGAGSLVSNSL